jgi:hypothetical protein
MGNPEGLTKEDIKQYIRYIADRRLIQLGFKPNWRIKENPLPWLSWVLNEGHTNFFEQRVSEYSVEGLKPSSVYQLRFNNIVVPIYRSVNILINHTTNITRIVGGTTEMNDNNDWAQSLRDTSLITANHTDVELSEVPYITTGSLIYFRTGSIWTNSAIVADVLNVSTTRTLLRCVYLEPDNINTFINGKVGLSVFTNTTGQDMVNSTSGDINIGNVVSIALSPGSTNVTSGTITTDDLGAAAGYFVIPCYTNGLKVPTGDTEVIITE